METMRVTEEGNRLWESQARGCIGWKRKRKKGGKRQREIRVSQTGNSEKETNLRERFQN